MTYAVRLRIRSTKGLTSDEQSIVFDLEGKTTQLTAPDGKTLRETPWFIFKAGGFPSQEAALTFGNRLKIALLVTGVRRWWGVDLGDDRATSMFAKAITDEWAGQGYFVRPNVHGLDVYEERDGTGWSGIEATGTVSADPVGLVTEVARLMPCVPPLEPKDFDAVRLLNEALISQEPAAQLVLAIAAVEMLADDEQWSPAQREMLERLAILVEQDKGLSSLEADEVATALRKGMYRLSVRQRHKRYLTSLGLDVLWKGWDHLYGQRSAILHGLTYSSHRERSDIVTPALRLCGRIVLTAVGGSVPGAADVLDEVMPLPG